MGTQRKQLILSNVRDSSRKLVDGDYGLVTEMSYYGARCAGIDIHERLTKKVKQIEYLLEREQCYNSDVYHPNVLRFLGICYLSKHQPFIVTEIWHKTLGWLILAKSTIPLYVKLSVLLDVSRGLWYLHSRNPPIVHGDLTPSDVFLTNNLVAKIGNIGFARMLQLEHVDKESMAYNHARAFKAPEALAEIPEYSPPTDVFSYGAVVLYVVNQDWPEPLQEKVHKQVHKHWFRKKTVVYQTHVYQKHLDRMSGYAAVLKPLVETCLLNNPSERPSMEAVCKKVKGFSDPYINVDNTSWRLENKFSSAVPVSPEVAGEPVLVRLQSEQQKAQQREQLVESLKHQLSWDGKMTSDSVTKAIQIDWEDGLPLLVTRAVSIAVLYNGVIYLSSIYEANNFRYCSKSINTYNIDTEKWSLSRITTPQSCFGMTVVNNKLVIVGGMVKMIPLIVTDTVYALAGEEWTDFATLLSPKASPTAVGVNSLLLVIGGSDNKDEVKSDVELLDTATGQWQVCTSIPEPQVRLMPAIVGNTLYLMGGSGVKHQPSQAAFSLSLDSLGSNTLEWHHLPLTPLVCSSPVGAFDEYLLAIGGKKRLGGKWIRSSDIFILNLTTWCWELVGAIPAERSSVGVVSDDKRIFVFGGANNDVNYDNMWISK